jgi:hypothetical protein
MAAYGWAVFTSSNLSEMFERYWCKFGVHRYI